MWEDTQATAGAAWGAVTGQLALTVLDTDPDNYGSYAGDGLDDDWQFNFFGPDNPLAVPVAVGIGVPLYSNAAGVLPLVAGDVHILHPDLVAIVQRRRAAQRQQQHDRHAAQEETG